DDDPLHELRPVDTEIVPVGGAAGGGFDLGEGRRLPQVQHAAGTGGSAGPQAHVAGQGAVAVPDGEDPGLAPGIRKRLSRIHGGGLVEDGSNRDRGALGVEIEDRVAPLLDGAGVAVVDQWRVPDPVDGRAEIGVAFEYGDGLVEGEQVAPDPAAGVAALGLGLLVEPDDLVIAGVAIEEPDGLAGIVDQGPVTVFRGGG